MGDLAGVGSWAAFRLGLPQLYVSLVGLTAPATCMRRSWALGPALLHMSDQHCFHKSRALPGPQPCRSWARSAADLRLYECMHRRIWQ